MKTGEFARRVLILAITTALAGCTVGTEFVRPPPNALELGKTTYNEVVERLGKPESETRVRNNDILLREISYSYVSDAEAPKVPNTMGGRFLTFMLSDDVVVAERFTSSYATDATDFDDRKVADIVKGKTRCEEVVSMLGRPSVRAIHPLVETKGESLIAYSFFYVKRPVLQFKTFSKSLVVECDPEGVVRKVSYSEEGDR